MTLRVTEKAIQRMRRNFEATKIRAAFAGFVLSNADDEMDRLEHGKVVLWDPTDEMTGHSWLYRGDAVPAVR